MEEAAETGHAFPAVRINHHRRLLFQHPLAFIFSFFLTENFEQPKIRIIKGKDRCCSEAVEEIIEDFVSMARAQGPFFLSLVYRQSMCHACVCTHLLLGNTCS